MILEDVMSAFGTGTRSSGRSIRFAGFVTVIGFSCLARSDGGIVDQFQKMLAVAGDDGQFLRVLTERIELVGESGLELLAGDIGKLGFGDEGLGFGADKLLLEDNDTGRVGLFVFELSDLVGDLLLAVAAGLNGSFNVTDALDGNTVLIVAVDELVFELSDFVDQNAELVCHV